MQPPAMEARGLTKSYGKVAVLRGIDLTIAPGTVFALLGPNGAGKTTTVRILATLLAADTGTARVAGRDVRTERSAVRRAISLTGQYAALDEQLTGAENLRMVGRLARLSRAAARAPRRRTAGPLPAHGCRGPPRGHVLRRYAQAPGPRRLARRRARRRLPRRADHRTRSAQPAGGVGPGGRAGRLRGDGLPHHPVPGGGDRLADRIALIDGGRIVAEGTAAELKRLVAAERLDLTLTGPEAYATVERLLGHLVVRREPAERSLGVATSGRADHIRELLDTVDPERSLVERFTVHGATLDDVFMTLTDKEPSHV